MTPDAVTHPEDAANLGYILDALLDAVENNPETVIEMFKWFRQEGVVVNNFIATRVITAYGKLDQPDAAHDLLDSMGRQADSKTFGALISIYAKAGDVKTVEELIGKLQAFGLAVDERSRGSRVMAYAKTRAPTAGDLGTAVALFDRMRKDALKPHLSVCNALVSACAKSAAAPQALHVLRCMNEDRTRPNSVTLAALLQACWNARNPGTAVEVLTLCVGNGLLDKRVGYAVEGLQDHVTLEPHRLIVDRRDSWRTDHALEALGWAVAHFHLHHHQLRDSTKIDGRAVARDAALAVQYQASERSRR